MTLDELTKLSLEALTEWLIIGQRTRDAQADALHRDVLQAAEADQLPAEFADKFIRAHILAAEVFEQEAATFRMLARRQRAGISRVIDGGLQD